MARKPKQNAHLASSALATAGDEAHAGLQTATLALLGRQERILTEEQRSYGPGGGGDLDALAKLTNAVGAFGRSVAAILAEARKQDDAIRDRIGKLTDDEKVALLRDFLDDLPIGQRRAVRAYLDSLEERL